MLLSLKRSHFITVPKEMHGFLFTCSKEGFERDTKLGKIAFGFEFWRNSRTTSVVGLPGLVEFEIPFEMKKKYSRKKLQPIRFPHFLSNLMKGNNIPQILLFFSVLNIYKVFILFFFLVI